ncbi:MAG: hypothetical protein AB7F19_07050 [Candidatus Babeliales bacterium]
MKAILSIYFFVALYATTALSKQDLPIITLSHNELHTGGDELDIKLLQAARQGFFI